MGSSKKPKIHWSEYLDMLGACSDGVEFAKEFKTVGDAYRELDYIDNNRAVAWFYWLCGSLCGQLSTMTAIDEAMRRYMPNVSDIGLDGIVPETQPCSVQQLKRYFPVPTLSDLKQAAARARGDTAITPWELLEP